MIEHMYTVVEPNSQRWAVFLDDSRPVRDLIHRITHALNLPADVEYELIPLRTRKILPNEAILPSAGIQPGEELYIRPKPDSLLSQLLESLYEEAVDTLAEEAFNAAEAKVRGIFRLDPKYPDPQNLKAKLKYDPAAFIPQPGSSGASPLPAQGPPSPAIPAGGPSPMQYAQYHSPSGPPRRPPTQLRPRGGGGSGTGIGCAIGFAVVAGFTGLALIIGGLLIAKPLYDYFSNQTNIPRPISDNILDPDNDDNFIREGEPVLGTGDVQITLRWDADVDLDLHVIDPYGEEIYYQTPSSNSGGILDVDANAACEDMRTAPVENVFWPSGGAPHGSYQAVAVYYMTCDYQGPVDYQITIKLDGIVVQTSAGTISSTNSFEEDQIIYFDY